MAKSLSELTSNSIGTDSALKSKSASVKKIKKEPEIYVFRLVTEHPKYYEGSSVFPPRVMISNKDVILWNFGTEEEPDLQPRQIRYVDGLNSIFVDEQEVNGALPENIANKQTNEIVFENGHLRVPSWKKQLILFLKINNQCEQQKNKFKNINNLYRLLDFVNTDDNVIDLGKKKDRAYDVARSASEEDMIPHAKFLGIPFTHPATGEERDIDAIREDYKSKALESPEKFLLYANNPKVKIRFIVEKALNNSVITTGLVKGQVHWVLTKQMIAEIPTNKNQIDAIVDYASSTEGEAFLRTLKTQL